MITTDQAKRQIRRMTGLRFFPTEREAQMELVRSLEAHASDEKAAEEIISRWVRDNTDAPTPAHLHKLCEQKPAREPKPWLQVIQETPELTTAGRIQVIEALVEDHPDHVRAAEYRLELAYLKGKLEDEGAQ